LSRPPENVSAGQADLPGFLEFSERECKIRRR
jgi:hypothetical protein